MMYVTDEIPSDMEDRRDEVISTWDVERIVQSNSRYITDLGWVETASKLTQRYFTKNSEVWNKGVLETHTGDGCASRKFQAGLEYTCATWICTDILHGNEDAVTAVQKYGPHVRILLMIHPPAANEKTLFSGEGDGGDFYAMQDFIKQTPPGMERYIIMVGKIGYEHGTRGIYRYVMEKLDQQTKAVWLEEHANNYTGALPPVEPIEPGVLIIHIVGIEKCHLDGS